MDWQGVRHNVSFRERVVLWADRPYAMPDWVSEHRPHSLQTTRLFDDSMPANLSLSGPLAAHLRAGARVTGARERYRQTSSKGSAAGGSDEHCVLAAQSSADCPRHPPHALHACKSGQARSRPGRSKRLSLGTRSAAARRPARPWATLDEQPKGRSEIYPESLIVFLAGYKRNE